MSTDNYSPVGLIGAEVADLLTFFLLAYKFYGSDRGGGRSTRLVRPFEMNLNLTVIGRPEH